jgi:hypothetical protein
MTRKFAINIVGYIEDELEKYDKDAIHAMLNRQAITECFNPLEVVEVVVQSMTPEHTISPDKVSTKKLSQI